MGFIFYPPNGLSLLELNKARKAYRLWLVEFCLTVLAVRGICTSFWVSSLCVLRVCLLSLYAVFGCITKHRAACKPSSPGHVTSWQGPRLAQLLTFQTNAQLPLPWIFWDLDYNSQPDQIHFFGFFPPQQAWSHSTLKRLSLWFGGRGERPTSSSGIKLFYLFLFLPLSLSPCSFHSFDTAFTG